jgi:hypothetical protein
MPAGQLIWAYFLPHCPVIVVPTRHAKKSQNIGINKNFGTCQDFTYFHQTLAVNITASRHPIKNGKSKGCSP